MNGLRIALTALLHVGICSATHARITLFEGSGIALASDGIGDAIYSYSRYDGTSIPTVPDPLQLEAFEGDTYSKNSLKWSVAGNQTTLSFDTIQNRSGTRGAFAQLVTGLFVFSSSETVCFELTGFFNVSDVGQNESGQVRLSATVYDITANERLAYDVRESTTTPNSQLLLGAVGIEDNTVFFAPRLTGTIIAGHTMWFDGYLRLLAVDPDSGASAVGNITLKIGTVPEPKSAALCSVFAFLGLIRRRQPQTDRSVDSNKHG